MTPEQIAGLVKPPRYSHVRAEDGYASMMCVRPEGAWVRGADFDALARQVLTQQARITALAEDAARAHDLALEMERLREALKEAETRAEKSQVEAEFFQSEVKLRNRISTTSEGMADLQRKLENAEADLISMGRTIVSMDKSLTEARAARDTHAATAAVLSARDSIPEGE